MQLRDNIFSYFIDSKLSLPRSSLIPRVRRGNFLSKTHIVCRYTRSFYFLLTAPPSILILPRNDSSAPSRRFRVVSYLRLPFPSPRSALPGVTFLPNARARWALAPLDHTRRLSQSIITCREKLRYSLNVFAARLSMVAVEVTGPWGLWPAGPGEPLPPPFRACRNLRSSANARSLCDAPLSVSLSQLYFVSATFMCMYDPETLWNILLLPCSCLIRLSHRQRIKRLVRYYVA